MAGAASRLVCIGRDLVCAAGGLLGAGPDLVCAAGKMVWAADDCCAQLATWCALMCAGKESTL